MTSNGLADIDVVVLAGGLGTRISAVLNDTPKILAPIGDRPYIEFLIAWLKSFGATRIVFGLGHLAGAVEAYLVQFPPEGIDVVVVKESKPLGTGGAIANVRSNILSDPVLIMNGDSFVDANLNEFCENHLTSDAEVTILCTHVPDARRYGTVELVNDNEIFAFKEKNDEVGSGLINAGIYLFNSNIVDEIALNGPSLEQDFFQQQPAGRLRAMAGDYTFLDIGTPDDLAKAPDVLGKYFK